MQQKGQKSSKSTKKVLKKVSTHYNVETNTTVTQIRWNKSGLTYK